EGSIESVRYRALISQAERIRLGLRLLARLQRRMQRERAVHSGVQILGEYLKETAQVLQAIGNALLSGIPAEASTDILAACESLTLRLRQEAENLPASFLAAVARDARFQMDALNGQLRAALDLTAHATPARSEEHTSELQSRVDLVCRLL